MENTYKAGNTIRVTCEFRDFSNTLVDPSIIRFKVYDQKYNLILDTSVSPVTNKDSQGVYFYDYPIPMEYVNQKLIYEWYGEIAGNPSLERGRFKIIFI